MLSKEEGSLMSIDILTNMLPLQTRQYSNENLIFLTFDIPGHLRFSTGTSPTQCPDNVRSHLINRQTEYCLDIVQDLRPAFCLHR